MKQFIKHVLTLITVFILFLIIGAWAPFMKYPEIRETDGIQFASEIMRTDSESPDRAAILETNLSALDERIRLMNQAQEEIIIASYDVRDGESTRDILAVALKKADEGVKVRFLTDGISGLVHMDSELFRAVAAHPNIEIRLYNMPNLLEPWKFMGRMHDKYLIVDDLCYILGGRNMFDYFIGEYPTEHRSRDREVLIYNTAHDTKTSYESSLLQLRDYFESVWNLPDTTIFDKKHPEDMQVCEKVYSELDARYQHIRSEKPGLFESPDYVSMTQETRGVYLISNPTGLYAKQPVVFKTLCELMKLAEDEVIIHSPYAVLNGYMADSLKFIAEKKPVTLMVNARENGDNIVASSDYTYHRDDVLDTGVNLLEYAGGESYHGKSIAIDDDLSIIGSFNLDLRSTYVDTELMLVIKSEDINAQLRRNMFALHADCVEITTENESIVPAGLAVPKASFWKKAVWHVLGLILQPIRILV